jgi:adenylate cyclase
VGGLGLSVAWAASRERAERAQLMGIFARHVSPEVADAIWRQRDEILVGGRLRPQHLTATVLMLDMRGFTENLKKFDPEALMAWLGDFIEAMALQVGEHGGVVDDYFGDGLKADFGVPIPRRSREAIAADAEHAVRCAVAMTAALERVNASHRARGLPEVGMRIGIASGAVVAGSIGSADRLKYTSVGDVVVTAQRLEATTSVAHDFERWPVRILIAESTRRLLEGRIEVEPVGSVPITRQDDRVPAYRVPLDAAEGGKP